MCKTAVLPECHTSSPHRAECTNSRPHSSPCRVYSRSDFENMFRPSSTTDIANPILSFLDIKRILFKKITNKGDELKKAFQLLDIGHNMTVSKNELRRIITTFLLPLTREQFQDVLAQIPLTSSGAVPYLEFLSRFGGIDPNINVIKRGSGNEISCRRTLKELEIQIGEKIFKNIKTIIKALKLIDANKAGLIQLHELRRVLETFCLKMEDDEFKKQTLWMKDGAISRVSVLTSGSYHISKVSWENLQVKNFRREHLSSSDSSDSVWKDFSLDEIERTFCQELSKSYERVEKALSAGDPSKCGCISLNYLKIVLDTFVYRLPRRIFIQLMKRFGLKTTRKVNWKQFLKLLYEPKRLEVNRTIPLTKKNRYEPKRQITREDLRHIINCTVVKISDSEFKELMQALDPGCTGLVDVSTFIELLEENPKVGRLPSSTDAKAPLLLAWDSVDEIVQDAIARNLLPFNNMLQSYDLADTGLVGRNNFRKIMRIFCPFLPMEQLSKVCSKFQDTASGRILYKNFLASIGLNGPPTVPPVLAPKDQPLSEHFQKEGPWPLDLSERSKPTEDKNKSTLTKNMTKGEVLEKLKNCVQQQDPAFRKRFLDFGKELDGKVNRPHFRKVLENNRTAMENDPYAQPTAKVGRKREGLSYREIAAGDPYAAFFQTDGDRDGIVSMLDLHRLLQRLLFNLKDAEFERFLAFSRQEHTLLKAATRPPIPPSICSGRLPIEICGMQTCGNEDPYAAFFQTDGDRDGIVSMLDLHRLLQRLLFNLKDAEFERFLGLLGLRLSVTLNFREFRNLLERRPFRTDDAPQRLIRSGNLVFQRRHEPGTQFHLEIQVSQCHKVKSPLPAPRLQPRRRPESGPADVSGLFVLFHWSVCLSWHQYHVFVVSNFIETDNEGNGILRRRDVKNALYGFDIPLTPREFEKLWMRGMKGIWNLDKNKITRRNFIETDNEGNGILRRRDIKNALYGFDIPLTPREFEKLWMSYDTEGRGHITYQEFLQKLGINYSEDIHRPYVEDHFNFMGHFTKPQQVQEEVRELQQSAEKTVPARDKLMDHYQDISKALSRLDRSRGGSISMCRMQKVLQDCGCSLKEEELTQLLHSWGISLQNNSINYLDFLRAMENSKLSTQPKEEEEAVPIDFATLNPEEVLKNVQKVVASCGPALSTAFSALDKEDTGFVKSSDFGQVLKDFCYKLADNQYHYFLRKLRIHLSPYINWKYFLQNFNCFLEERKLYYLSPWRLLRRWQVMKGSSFDRLWSEMPINAKGRLRYPDFLSRFGSEKVATPPATGDSAKAHRGSSVPEVSDGNRSAASSPTRDLKAATKQRSHPCTPAGTAALPGTPPLQNLEPVENKLRKKIQGCWRQFLKECKAKDVHKHGEITASEFLALVEKFNLDISKEERQQLIVKYDLRDNGKFAYCDFIQSCVLLLKAKETSLMQRMKIQNAHKMKEAGPETSSFYSALLRIQPQIVHCWRPMRRAFKASDEGGTGLVGVADFRKVSQLLVSVTCVNREQVPKVP
ncbi:EF-hand calcium-binding domain-containing protein 6 [Pteropus vampyrus]|uniref:EF-hand calcium-binding domain-containing protein 6 n=1 Tax=Pteropus vampyrus TaxID=132908 RepID=A0A6P6CWH5_PTEVA|nr:EF-hand calcium-binding domain-containing protein 6 [Pteropus vampyrus]